ncbi:MAG: hypothetical protein FJ319_03610 [SAR202 cluster bacterium]|nr:hypothetical protein [SAR202 cluster bacterium]
MEIAGYRINRPEEIETPAFLIYVDIVKHNIAQVVKVCGSADRVVPHFKTHKSSDILKLQMAGGLTAYKCATMKEAEVLAANGVKEIIVAYPTIHPKKLARFVALVKKYPKIEIKTIISKPEHLKTLSELALANKITIGVYMDLNTGMHRTGAQPGKEAADLYIQTAKTKGLKAIGVHVFDGENLYKPDIAERKALVAQGIGYMRDIWAAAEKAGVPVTDNVAAGSWGFHLYMDEPKIRVSPGTFVYWDHRNATMSELPFKPAALVLGQVVDAHAGKDTVTCDIGSKAASPDQPTNLRFKVAGYPQAELVSQSEEHGVIKLNGAPLKVGDYILAIPGHACTTTVKFPYGLRVNAKGDVTGRYEHDARDRD